MSGFEILGAISGLIGIVDASLKICNDARKDLKLPETFEVVVVKLPIIRDILQKCETKLETIQAGLPPDVCVALEKIIDRCEEKADDLKQIFEKVIPGEHDGWKKRYTKILQRLGNGSKVEELMLSITRDVQLIVNHHAVNAGMSEQNTELEKIVQELKSVKSSVYEDESLGNTFNSGGGAQTNNVNSGSGQQINNNAAVGTQNFHSVTVTTKQDFSYHGPVGICLSQSPDIDSQLFVGRQNELDQIHEALGPNGKTQEQRRVILGGMGGVGKTQLAIAYAKSRMNDFKSVFWLNATSETTLKDSFSSIAGLIFDIQDSGALSSDQALVHIHRWLSNKKNTRWLLLFDNHDDPKEFDIRKYYPHASHGSAIVTTRRSDLVGGKIIDIRPLSSTTESLQILATRSQRAHTESVASQDPYATRLAKRLAGFPLALATAGIFLRNSGFSFERYLQEYEKRWNINPEQPVELEEYRDRTLYTTWDISYKRLQAQHSTAALLLKALAYFDNQSIWYELLLSGVKDNSPEWLRTLTKDDIKVFGAMKTLTDYCFLEVQRTDLETTTSWTMHNCIHDWAVLVLNHDIDVQNYWYAFDCVAVSANVDENYTLELLSFARLAAHALRLVQEQFWHNERISIIGPGRLNDVMNVTDLLDFHNQPAAAEQILQRALSSSEQGLGVKHETTLWLLNSLAGQCHRQGKLEQAEDFYKQVLAGADEFLGPEHTTTLVIVRDLADLYFTQDRLRLAEQLLRRALTGLEKVLGDFHLSTPGTVIALGNLYLEEGQLSQAKPLLQRGLAGSQETLGDKHTLTLDAMGSLGGLYLLQGRFAPAGQFLQRALVVSQELFGAEHESTLHFIGLMALLYDRQGKLGLANQYYEQALTGSEALQLENLDALTLISNFGIFCWRQNRVAKARHMFQRVARGRERILGADHPRTLAAFQDLKMVQSIIDKEGVGEDDNGDENGNEICEEDDQREQRGQENSAKGRRDEGLRKRFWRRLRISAK
ncbi:hypothetical protein LTR84_005080 [Exophiala bonariae]|uniref:NACHT-NTPase and P-loop NTPases N-terminal domain-containing protein n=1 Tax=Exophiala bonariae TaxID=1690606 RepID=A0AAV9NS83_9EURO|nr:hypothetical protein LTR84_005080 [Exophiala bonariae]